MDENKIIRVAFYIRVSTIEQGKHGYGLDYQLQALNDLIQYKGNQNPKWITNKKWIYEDSGFSGGDLNRPAYKRMLEDAKKGEFDMIAVWKIDRMSRNLSHLLKTFEDLKDFGVGFYSVKENIDFSGPIGKLTFQIFGALAEFEREMIKSRTIEGKIASARMGNFIKGSAPYGYRKEKKEGGKGSLLVIIKEESDIVKKIFEWFVYDDLNYSEIAKKLNEMKVVKGEGGLRKNIEFTQWYETTIKDILIRTVYTGYIIERFKKENEEFDVKINTPKIISKHLYELAKTKIDDLDIELKRGRRKYLLSGKIYDALENTERGIMRKFVGVNRTKGGHSYRRDSFINNDGIKIESKEFPGKPLDDFVWSTIQGFINKPDTFFKLYKKQTTELNNIDTYNNDIIILRGKIDEEEMKKTNIEMKEISGRLSEEKADKYILESNKIIVTLQESINKLETQIEDLLNLELSKNVIDKVSENFKHNILNLNDLQKRRLIDMLVDKVLVYYDDDGVKEVKVIFRFNVDVDNNDNTNIEPTSGLDKIKNTCKSVLSLVYGAPSRIRTHGRPRFAA